MKCIALVVVVVACKSGSGPAREEPGTKPATAELPRPAGPPSCVIDPQPVPLAVDGPLGLIGDQLVAVTFDPKRSAVVLAEITGKELGAVPVAANGSEVSVDAPIAITGGFATLFRVKAPAAGHGGYGIARFGPDGAARGAFEIPRSMIARRLPGLGVVATGDAIVLLEETAMLEHAQVRVLDLDGKQLGEPVDAEAGRFSIASTRIGTTHAIAALLRDSEGGPERLRVFDVDKRAWLGPAIPLGDDPIYGAAPLGADAAVLMQISSRGIAGAKVTADGTLGAWTRWTGEAELRTAHDVYTSPDGARTYFDYADKDGDKISNYFGAVALDGTAAVDTQPTEGVEFSSSQTLATRNTVYRFLGDQLRRYRCK